MPTLRNVIATTSAAAFLVLLLPAVALASGPTPTTIEGAPSPVRALLVGLGVFSGLALLGFGPPLRRK